MYIYVPGFLRELQSTGGCAEAGLPAEAASLDDVFREAVINLLYITFFLVYFFVLFVSLLII